MAKTLCQTWSETTKTGFLASRHNYYYINLILFILFSAEDMSIKITGKIFTTRYGGAVSSNGRSEEIVRSVYYFDLYEDPKFTAQNI